MAAVTGTSSSYSVGSGGGNREDLEDVIHELFPDETFFVSNADRVSASATLHEWLGDQLASPGSNIHIEGDDAGYATIANPSRYSNYTQIVKDTFIISGTQEVVNKAGRRSEIGRQAVKQMREAKNDLEWALVRNQIGTAGGTATGRSLASVEAWIGASAASHTAATQVVLSTTTASASTAPVSSGTPGTAIVDGTTTAALAESEFDLALQSNYNQGSTTDIVLVNATAKNYINAFTGIAQRQTDVGRTQQASITGAADLYVSNYGVHRIVLHRHVRTSVALCLDMSLWAVGTLRNWQMEEMAKTGDAEKRQILCEKTLVCRNPLGNSKIVAIA